MRYKVFHEPKSERYKTIMVKKQLKDKLEQKREEGGFYSLTELLENLLENDGKKRK